MIDHYLRPIDFTIRNTSKASSAKCASMHPATRTHGATRALSTTARPVSGKSSTRRICCAADAADSLSASSASRLVMRMAATSKRTRLW